MTGRLTPVEVSRNLADAISIGDLDGAASSFSHRGRLMTPGETILEGRGAIRELLAQLIAMQVKIRSESRRLVYLDDRALLTEAWSMSHGDLAGNAAFERTTRALSLHCRVDGEGWKIIFLAPWGFD